MKRGIDSLDMRDARIWSFCSVLQSCQLFGTPWTAAQQLPWSFAMDYYDDVALPSLTALHPAMHPYEREISELYNVEFDSNPWNKPLRFSLRRRTHRSLSLEGAHRWHVGARLAPASPGSSELDSGGSWVTHGQGPHPGVVHEAAALAPPPAPFALQASSSALPSPPVSPPH